MTESVFDNLGSHVIIFLAGSTGLGIVGHMVATFPTPSNKYGAWLLGVVQFIVGQRIAAANTLQGKQTMAIGLNSDTTEVAIQQLTKKNDSLASTQSSTQSNEKGENYK